jgi:ribonuclease T
MLIQNGEMYISVDIETTGATVGRYSMFQLGACVVGNDSESFFRNITPLNSNFDQEAFVACNFPSMKVIFERGQDPVYVMKAFYAWVKKVSLNFTPIFVGFNAPFDWKFVDAYFDRFVGKNPFNRRTLDIKAYYMGMMNCSWAETSPVQIDERFQSSKPHTHNALDDATQQADVFRKMVEFNRRVNTKNGMRRI